MIGTVHQLLDEHGQLQAPARKLKSDADLYAAGLEQSPIRLYRIRRPRNSSCIRWV